MLAFVIPSFYFNGLPSALSYAVLVNYRYEYRFSFDGFATLLTLLLFGALWLILQGDLLYVLSCAFFVLVLFSPFRIAITSLGEERTNLSGFRTFDRFVLVWICRFPLPLNVSEGLRFVIVALPGLFSYLF